jgi:aromatic ring-cleaving dioxygenase
MSGISSFHAHIYFDAAGRKRAERLRAAISERFAVRMGSWHDGPVGPHPRGMYQVAFAPELFAELVPWLMLNRDGLVVLVHPNSGAPYADHLVRGMWLGAMLPLTASYLPRSETPAPVVVNTTPRSVS